MKHCTAPGRMFQSPAVLAWWLGLVLCLALPTLGEAAVEGVPCTPEPTDMVVSYGNLVTCAIDVSGDTDVFRFSGSAGERVVVQVSRSSGSGTPLFDLFRPDGTRIGSSSITNSRIDAALDQTGTHTILVTEFLNNDTVGYALALERVAPPSPPAKAVQYGQTLNDEINPVGDMDLFSFQGTSGDSITVQVSRSSGSGTPLFDLFRPDGTRIGSSSITNSRIDAALDQTGTHTILVTEFLNNDTVGYALALQCVAGPCRVAPPGSLIIFPPSGTLATTFGFDVGLIVDTPGRSVVGWNATLNGTDVTAAARSCLIPGTLLTGGWTFRCHGLTGGALGAGTHTLSVTANLSDGTSVSDSVTWEVLANTEP